MSEPCSHEREFAGTQRDTLTSFIQTSGALVAMTAERDALRATIAADIRAWSEARSAERQPEVCEDAEEGYCHHDAAFAAYALAARIAEGKLLVEPTDQPKGKP